METVRVNMLVAGLALGLLAFVAWFVFWVLCTAWNAVVLYRKHAAWDAEYWPRRLAQIEAECFYRNVPARLDKWQQERSRTNG